MAIQANRVDPAAVFLAPEPRQLEFQTVAQPRSTSYSRPPSAPVNRLTPEQTAAGFKCWFDSSNYRRWKYCGALRRGAKSDTRFVHLVEPLTLPIIKDGQSVALPAIWIKLQKMLDNGIFKRPGQGFKWTDMVRQIQYQGNLHTIILADNMTWGFAEIVATGPNAFASFVVEALGRRGFEASLEAMAIAQNGELVAAETERDVFTMAGIPWVEPSERFSA